MLTLVKEVTDFVNQNGGVFRDWYAGIATNPKQRLFNEHNVKENGLWICTKNPCATDTIARQIEKTLLNLGFDGGTGGGDSSTKHVYVYKKTPYTIE